MLPGSEPDPISAFDDLVERFDHVSVAVNDIAAALPLVELMGGRYRDGGDSAAGFRWAQFRLPTAGKLELIQPLDPEDAGHFLVRFLQSRGEGVHHLTFKVTDLAAAVARAEALGLEVVSIDTSHGAWKEAFVHPRSANGVLVQLAEWVDGPEPKDRSLEDLLSGGSR